MNNTTVGLSVSKTGFVKDDMFCAVCARTHVIYVCL